MTETLRQTVWLVLFFFNTGLSENLELETLVMVQDEASVFSVLSLQNQLNERGVSLHLSIHQMDMSTPFASYSRLYTHLRKKKLLLLSPSLCDSERKIVWIKGLPTPYLCYMETTNDNAVNLIYMYSKTCLGTKEVIITSLKGCLEALKSRHKTDSIIGTVINSLPWKIAIVFFGDKLDNIAASVSAELSSRRVQCLMYQISSNLTDEEITNLISHVISLVPISERNFLLLCDVVCIRRILTKANAFNDRITAMQMMSSWLLVLSSEEFCTLDITDLSLDNVAAVIIASPYVSAMSSFTGAHVSTLLYKNSSREWNAVAYMETPDHNNVQNVIFPNRYFGFNQRKLLVAALRLAPYTFVHVDEKNETIYEGFCIDLLHELAMALNFTYHVVEPDDLEWGRVLKNGSWTGVVGLLERLEVDMTVAPLVITEERETVMDFSYPYYHDVCAGMYKLPDEKSSKWLTLIQPFALEVFVCIGAVFLSSLLLLSGVEYAKVRHETKPTDVEELLSSCLLEIAGAFLKHGGQMHLVSTSGRILVSFLAFFCITIIAAYSGNLMAFLTVTKTYPPFRTLAEVAQQKEYVWGTDGGSMWRTLFQTSNISDYKMIWKGIESHNKTRPEVLNPKPEHHRQMIEKGSYIFFFDRDAIALWKENNCDLALLEETFYQITYGVGLPQNSPYSRMISAKMLQIEQSGLLQVWKRNWWPNGSTCTGQMQVTAKAIELIDIQSAFYLLSMGVCISLFVLFTETLRKCSGLTTQIHRNSVSIQTNN